MQFLLLLLLLLGGGGGGQSVLRECVSGQFVFLLIIGRFVELGQTVFSPSRLCVLCKDGHKMDCRISSSTYGAIRTRVVD